MEFIDILLEKKPKIKPRKGFLNSKTNYRGNQENHKNQSSSNPLGTFAFFFAVVNRLRRISHLVPPEISEKILNRKIRAVNN